MNNLFVPNNTIIDLIGYLEYFNLKDNRLINSSLEQSMNSHEYQERDGGESYLEQHIYPITIDVMLHYDKEITPEIVSAALLHDVLEDDKSVDVNYFTNQFGSEVYSIVKPLTKSEWRSFPGNSKSEKKHALNLEYFKELNESSDASKIIKLADRWNNIQCIHLAPDKDKLNYYIAETKEFYLPFAKENSTSYYEKISNRVEQLESMIKVKQ